MPEIKSIFGVNVIVGEGERPPVGKKISPSARFIGSLYRGDTMWFLKLIDHYYIAYSKDRKRFNLWARCRAEEEILEEALTWCESKGIDEKSAAAAMLEFVWLDQNSRGLGGTIGDDLELVDSGLLSKAALTELMEICFVETLESDEPFIEPEVRKAAGGLGCGITEAGPNHRIYKNGWIVGGVTQQPSQPREEREQGQGSPLPQEWYDQIAQEFREQMGAEPPKEEKE